jgi:hypothetical protein
MQPGDSNPQLEPEPQWEAFSQFPVAGGTPEPVQPPAPAKPEPTAFWSSETPTLDAALEIISREIWNLGRVAQAINVAAVGWIAWFVTIRSINPDPLHLPSGVVQAVLLCGPLLILFVAGSDGARDGPRSVASILALVGTIGACLCWSAWQSMPKYTWGQDLMGWLLVFVTYAVAIGFGLVVASVRRSASHAA